MNTNCRLLGREESEESEIHDFWTFACSDFHRYLLFHEYLMRKGTFDRGSFAKKQKFKLLDILTVRFFKFLYYFFFWQRTTITSNNLLFCLIIINYNYILIKVTVFFEHKHIAICETKFLRYSTTRHPARFICIVVSFRVDIWSQLLIPLTDNHSIVVSVSWTCVIVDGESEVN